MGLLQRKPKPGICLKNVECLVVDESDKLFETNSKDGGFRQQLATIYKACANSKVQLAMFSATYQSNVEEWCRQHLDNVVEGGCLEDICVCLRDVMSHSRLIKLNA